MGDWGSYLLNDIVMVASAGIFALSLGNLYRIAPALLRCTSIWRTSFSFERNLQLARTRDLVALTLILPFCIVADLFSLREPALLGKCPVQWHFAATLGLFAAFCLLRTLAHLFILCRPGTNNNNLKVAFRSDRNTFIVWGCLAVLTALIVAVLPLGEEAVKRVFMIENAVVYAFHLCRKSFILRSDHRLFPTFLYLCALELIPVGAAVACTLLL